MIQFQPGQAILEVGGGERPQFRPNMDIRPGPAVDIVHDLNEPFPQPDNTYDGVFSMYLIEHISWRKVRQFISETCRVIKPGGGVIIITANLLEQCRTLVNLQEWTDKYVCMLFGDQNYVGKDWTANAHHCGFSPEFAIRLFKEAGFLDVVVNPHPNCNTDMVIEARKPMLIKPTINAAAWTPEQREKAFDRLYFDGGRGGVGGYAREGYWDYPVHWTTFKHAMDRKPESVLEIGCARGYILKRLEDAGIPVCGLEVSKHCYGTRVVKHVHKHDLTKFPWPVKDKEYDLCFSIATLEHIPEDKIPELAQELERVSKRGLHGVDFGDKDDGFDKTHCTMHDKAWWEARLPKGHEVVSKEDLESGPVQLPPGDGKVKLNVGCFTVMSHFGWVNMDIQPLQQWAQQYGFTFRQHDVTKGMPFDDGCVDLIYSSHLIEHLDYRQAEKFLKECRRVMKKDAVIRIITPNAGELMEGLKHGILDAFDEINDGCANAKSQMERFHALACSNHASMYDSTTLINMLSAAGFSHVEHSEFRKSISQQILKETLDMFPQLSLFADAIA